VNSVNPTEGNKREHSLDRPYMIFIASKLLFVILDALARTYAVYALCR
jgi:hypothetical protein